MVKMIKIYCANGERIPSALQWSQQDFVIKRFHCFFCLLIFEFYNSYPYKQIKKSQPI